MDYFIWDDEKYSVGDPLLDQQHRQVLEMINELIGLVVQQEADQERILELLLRMNEYAAQHFHKEEQRLDQVDYIALHQQRASHERYTEQISEWVVQFESGRVDFVSLLDFVRRWWEQHILVEDMAFKAVLEAS